MEYKRIFNPVESLPSGIAASVAQRGDRRDGRIYVYSDEIILAVNIALVTSRPLLVRGPSGAGKSTLAPNVALQLGLDYFEEVITSRTQAQNLLWKFDALRRLNDAQAHRLRKGMAPYIDPGKLWWAFDPQGAQAFIDAAHGNTPPTQISPQQALSTKSTLVNNAPGLTSYLSAQEKADLPKAVVLLDEIDKADPDVPNNLLVPIGSLQFIVPELNHLVVKTERPPLMIITTNDERELPNAFLRRCVILQMPDPDKDEKYRPVYYERLLQIAKAHFGNIDEQLYKDILTLMTPDHSTLSRIVNPITPSPAEFLDAIHVCLSLNVRPGNSSWDTLSKNIAHIVLHKARELVL